MAPAAEELGQVAQAKAGAGAAPHGEAPEISGALPVGGAAGLHGAKRLQIFRVVRLHAHGPADMLQGGYLIAQAVIG